MIENLITKWEITGLFHSARWIDRATVARRLEDASLRCLTTCTSVPLEEAIKAMRMEGLLK